MSDEPAKQPPMTKEQAAEIMGLFTATFPTVTISETTMKVWWESAFSGVDYELGQQCALDLLAKDAVAFPTPAAFNGRKNEILRRRSNAVATTVEDNGKWIPDPRAKAEFQKWRETLRTGNVDCETKS